MKRKRKKSFGEKILWGLAVVIAVLVIITLAARYGWRLAGFKACNSCGIESVIVTEEYVEIKGFDPGSFPASFIGYYAETEDGKMYVGFKFNALLGVLPEETGDFRIQIPIEEKVSEIYKMSGGNQYLIWSEETEELEEISNEMPNEMPNEMSEAYTNIIDAYYVALKEQWGGEKLISAGLNFMVAFSHQGSPLEDIGYIVTDINNDGRDELFIGSLMEDEFYGKMIFSLYSLDEEGNAVLIFDSIERNRYYYAGENKFANLGAGAFDSSFETTVKLESYEMIDMTYTTASEEYVQMKLTPFLMWEQ